MDRGTNVYPGPDVDSTATHKEDAVQQSWRAVNPLGWQWFLTPFVPVACCGAASLQDGF